MINLNFEYRIYPEPLQEQTLLDWLFVCKKVYNYCLAERKDWIKSRKSWVDRCSLNREYIIPADAKYPDYYHQKRQLTEAKKTNPELKAVQSQVLQEVVGKVDKAFRAFHQRGVGYPRFRKKIRSMVFPQFKTCPIVDDKIKLPKIGSVKIILHRPIPQGFVVKQVVVVQKASGWYAICTIQSEGNIPNPIADLSYSSLGIDLGFKKIIHTSKNESIDRPRFLLDLQGQLKSLQRKLKNKEKGSANWLKVSRKIALLHEKIHRKRKQYHYELSHHLCNQAKMIFIEDISPKAWGKGLLRKHSLDFAFGAFMEILAHVAKKRDVYLLKVNKDYTSQTCPNCGTLTGKKPLNERIHHCSECGFTCDRDYASSLVIEQRGLIAVGQTVLQSVEDNGIGGAEQSTPRSTRRSRKSK
ncbi:transposase IS891/IS1136/IS1341 family [Cyanobacterium stanieri PCC 7202]|uniref:Transposase IS891/IS1136/IS1341 family n=1 Tax=Cyanobacterium stanieri (strain ATCC 29140 / PCC 7202) TaxID=292563 RepID=K9YJL2_CYASC|nr:transposase IS891/IS1136/IS1341 family [Cyanobacterium stanieri PCC 7202]